ncbi:RagB/SusD family nutrient uptake outer membrane protein [Flavihumibacter sp. R14]|nr:RagB/SusD family nutrient uptake outer membrane protein [Flavihumibacter soli]
MKRLYICIAALSSLMVAGCSDLLDVKPQSSITEQVYFHNEGDFSPYVTGIYSYVRTLNDNIVYGTERSEELIPAANARFTTAWNHVINPTTGAVDYANWYQAIGHCNLLLDKIESFPFSNEATKNRLKAETYSLRAYFFFHLTRIIGDAPLMLQSITSSDVPLLARSSSKDVMKQVFADLDKAIALFPDQSFANGKYRFSYPAVQALKAEAKLWNAKVLGGGAPDFNDAITAVAEVEKAGLTLQANFGNVTTVRANSEIILSTYYNRDESGGNSNYALNALPFLSGVTGASNLAELPYCLTTSNGQGAYQISVPSRALFNVNPADKRIASTFVIELQGTTPKVAWIDKYPGTKYTDDRVSDNDIIVFRLADIYLMAAEAYAGINNSAKAIEYLDKVRLRAGTGAYVGVADKSTLEMEILNERGREFFFENKRWYDLVRFHSAGTINVYNYVPNLKGKTTPLFWPVAAKVMATNPLIEQTKGY